MPKAFWEILGKMPQVVAVYKMDDGYRYVRVALIPQVKSFLYISADSEQDIFDPDPDYSYGTAYVNKRGYIELPREMRRHAGIRDGAVFVGHLDNFEIWDKKIYEKWKKEIEPKMPEILEKAGFGRRRLGRRRDLYG